MTAILRNLITPPVFSDQERTRRARLVYSITGLIGMAALLYGIYRLLSSPELVVTIAVFGAVVFCAFVLYLVKRGSVQVAAGLLIGIIWVAFATLSAFLGGIRDSGYAGLAVSIALAGVLFGGRGALIITGLSLLYGRILVDFEVNNNLPIDIDTPLEVLTNYVAIFGILSLVLGSSQNGFKQLLRRIQDNEQAMRARNWELTQIRQSLEERVQERTQALDRRLQYLTGAAQVATAAGAILDPGELSREVVNLVQQQFGLYYVGLFLLDPVGEWAVLQAGTGAAGRAMLTRGHRIRVGDGMVGWALANNQARFAQQAEQDRVRVINPDLPDTRAEAALPLAARGRVMGALSVQSAQAEFFDEDTVLVLQTMADLIAVVLSNARLYAASQSTVQAAQRAYGDLTQQAWSQLLMLRANWGYRFRDGMVQPTADSWQEETTKAFDQGSVVTATTESAASVALPIRVAGNVIGAVNFRRGVHQGSWHNDEIAILTELVEQIAQALENARLLEESRQLAAREAQLSELSAMLANTLDVDAMLRTAVRELGKLPGVREAAVHLQMPESPTAAVMPETVLRD